MHEKKENRTGRRESNLWKRQIDRRIVDISNKIDENREKLKWKI